MAKNWRRARSLDTLVAEINAHAPKRSRTSDGFLGDAAHASRPSDHNPNARGVVCAGDLTDDAARGADMDKLAPFLIRHRHPALKYIILNRRIASARSGWKWVAYTGPNPHIKHMHVSVESPYDDLTPWGVALAWRSPATVQLGTRNADVRFLQGKLKVKVTGVADTATIQAVKRFQLSRGLKVDGVAGPKTWGVLI